jgi:hypothetical protein
VFPKISDCVAVGLADTRHKVKENIGGCDFRYEYYSDGSWSLGPDKNHIPWRVNKYKSG